MTLTTYQKGVQAENKACAFLLRLGYQIYEKRYQSPYGEIDIVCMQGDTLIAVEVKCRKSLSESKLAILERQKKRIEQALLYYYSTHEFDAFSPSFRFDVVLLSNTWQILHIPNAWIPHDSEPF